MATEAGDHPIGTSPPVTVSLSRLVIPSMRSAAALSAAAIAACVAKARSAEATLASWTFPSSGFKPCCNFAVDVFQRPSAARDLVELRCKPRAVGAKRVQLGRHRGFAGVGGATPLDGRCERVKRKRKAPARRFNRLLLGHCGII